MKAYNNQTIEEYYVHLGTKNTSFLKMALLLQNAGVKNIYFFLKLYDKGLKDVDPYDPNLSDEMKLRIFKECSINRWYFYREVFRVSETGASTSVGGGSPFILNRGNLAYLWAMELNISVYLVLPRQTGKTWVSIADCVWTHQFVRGSTVLHFNKSQSDSNMNLRRIQDAIRMLPMYMQHSNYDNLDPSDKRRVKNNEKSVRNAIDSTIEAMASAGNEAKADALARGKTASKIWYDEIAFIFFNETIYSAATPAYEKAREIAQKHESPYGISITTTPGDLATPHGAFAYKMMESSIVFNENFYDLKREKLFDIIHNTPDKTDFIFIQFSYLQLGETEEWYQTRFKKMNNPLKARREYLLEWINSNGNSPFDPDDVEIIGDMALETANTAEVYKINKYYRLTVYDEYHGKKPVLIGVDVSGGLGRDSTAIVVAHPETLKPMAIFRSNMIPSGHLKKLIVTLVTKRYPNCVLTIENNSVGKPLIDELLETPIGRVIYKEKKKRVIDQGAQKFTKKRTINSIEHGHNTNPTTRGQMMEMLESIVHNSPGHLGYKELYEEIRFLELKNGRIDHSSSTHDDVTMAYLGILWVVRYGNGLKGKGIYYNIDDGSDDEAELNYNTAASQRFASKLLLENDDDDDKAISDIESWLRKDLPVQTSSDWAERERREYYKALDKIDDIDIDDDPTDAINNIPDATQRLLMKNYNAFLTMDEYDEDPIAGILEPTIDYNRENESWSTLYKM